MNVCAFCAICYLFFYHYSFNNLIDPHNKKLAFFSILRAIKLLKCFVPFYKRPHFFCFVLIHKWPHFIFPPITHNKVYTFRCKKILVDSSSYCNKDENLNYSLPTWIPPAYSDMEKKI